jgi:hypothetical protein
VGEAGAGPGGAILGALLNILGPLFGNPDVAAHLQSLDTAVQTTWSNLLSVGVFLGAELEGVKDSVGGALDSIGKAFGWLLGHPLARLSDLLSEIVKLFHHLKALLAPLVKYLQTLQKEYNQVMGKQMRRWIDLVQRVRKILVPFRLLHIGIASKLDSYLARVESDIGAHWALLIAKQNQVIGVLNDVLDPRQLLRPGHALGTAGMAIGAIHQAIGAADVRTLFCAAPLQPAQPLVEPWAATSARVLHEIGTNSGDYPILAAQRDQALRQYDLDLGTSGPI